MIRVLGLALYGPLAASHRVRLGQYRDGLALAGIDLKVQSLLGNDYLRSRFLGGALSISTLLNAGLNRVGLLISREKFDLAVVHCELFPFLPWWLERMALRIPFIYDFDDAFYLRYQSGNFAWLNPVLGRKFDQFMRDASAITAGNRHLASYARRLNENVTVLPSVVDTIKYVPIAGLKSPIFTVGWIGSPSTAPYLESLVAPLQSLGRDIKLKLVVIGGKAPSIEGIEVVEFEWSEETEVDLINSFDVGVMPLPDDEWARGKCAFKLVQYMACGVPVVASRVGANIDLVTEECGFLVRTADQWVEAFRQLWKQPLIREKMGLASRDRAVEYYSLQANLPVFSDVIHRALERH
jgi:glycosyltransferase involved in cell wall biosynthesis